MIYAFFLAGLVFALGLLFQASAISYFAESVNSRHTLPRIASQIRMSAMGIALTVTVLFVAAVI